MPKVTFLPSNTVIEVKRGQTLLDIAIDGDVNMQHACGGCCACTTCHSEVVEGAANLSPIDADEEERLESLDERTPNSRLSCQAKVLGDVTVRVVNEN